MAAGMLAVAEGWRLMAGMAAGMLAVAEGRKESEFSWFLIGLQQLREVGRSLLGYLQQPKDGG
ncbi:hypothetical protein Pyn_16205 [Prunus yedoensis var. nudiflora]|uniref:Uncharacterized protein n=1 Tax=Prunus yedoensis var. nudiflora TaxID=2094558 RepID=A0A314YJ12_PRUYE|nr:hypothetical protein Pyn_16205 [Prunus yedoensis var. nudiflora]